MNQQTLTFSDETLENLARECKEETKKFHRSEPSDERFCLEIFRRALSLAGMSANGSTPIYADEAAREMLVITYQPYILSKIQKNPVWGMAREEIAQETWARFWSSARRGLVIERLASMLNLLALTAVTTVIELRRRQNKRSRDDYIDDLTEMAGEEFVKDPNGDIFSSYVRERFRQRCGELLPNPLEKRVFWEKYAGFTPREIARQLASEGIAVKGKKPTPRLVSDILESCFKRLEKDSEIRDLLHSD